MVRTTGVVEEWREAIRHDFVALDIHVDATTGRHADGFSGAVRSATVAHLQVSEVRSVTQVCRRTRSLVRADPDEFFQIGVVTRGRGTLEQDGRRAALTAGDFAIYETGRPFCWSLDGAWELGVFTWPRSALGLSAGESAAVTAMRFAGGSGLSGIVGGMLRGLLTAPPRLSAAGAVRVADEVGELVATVALERAAPAGWPGASQHLRHRVCAYIDDHLADPELTPASIAQAHFVSTRQLHRLFAAGGESVTRRIRRLRLEHCRRRLLDRRHAHAPVGDIARSFGFPDLASFSRAFRAAYGEAPSAYRARR